MQPASSVESVFARAWELLTRNWILIVPGLVIGVVVGVATAILRPVYVPSSDPGATVAHGMATFVSGMLVAGIAILGSIANQAYTTGMAGAAWQRGVATLADGTASLREDAGRIVMAMIALILTGILAAVLIPFTLGLSLLAFLFLTIYTMPAAIVGNVPGFAALSESFRIATMRIAPTLIVVVLIFVISLIGGAISLMLAFAPFIGPIVAAMLSQAFQAYVTLVVVGEYLNLRDVAGNPAPPAP